MNDNKDPEKAAALGKKITITIYMYNHNFLGTKFILLQIIPVILSNRIKNIKTNALLDSGSDITLISREVRSKLESKGLEKKLNINNVLSKVSETTKETVNISISSVCNTFDSSADACFVDELNISLNKFNIADLKGKYPHLQNIYFPLLQDSEIAILIDTDHMPMESFWCLYC